MRVQFTLDYHTFPGQEILISTNYKSKKNNEILPLEIGN